MSGFSFGFAIKSDDPNDSETQEESHQPSSESQQPLPFRWIDEIGRRLEERSSNDLYFRDVSIKGDTPLRCVDDAMIDHGQSDLVAGVYEGGAKVWECSLDLVRYLAERKGPLPSLVLELGCGHGLPALYVLREQLLQNKRPAVVLLDYNAEVLESVTLDNLVLNTGDALQGQVAALAEHIWLGAGDWMQLKDHWPPPESDLPLRFDLILAAETLYTAQSAQETATLLERHLADDGVALIATKRYYFGVGGGTDAFVRACAPLELSTELVREFDTGTSNIREILKVTRQSR